MVGSASLMPLSEIMGSRREIPDPDAVESGEVPLVAKVSFEGQITLRTSVATSTSLLLVHPGDILFSGINAVRGAIARHAPTASGPIAATIHYSAYSVDAALAEPEYVLWVLRSRWFRGELVKQLPGSIKSEIRPSRLLGVRVPVPDIGAQRELVTRWSEFSRRAGRLHGLSKEQQGLAARLLQSFIDARFAAFRTYRPLNEVLSMKPRAGPSFLTSPVWSGTPVLMPSAVTGFGVDLTRIEYGSGDEIVSGKDRLEPGDIILARGNKRDQVGNAGVVPDEARNWVCANLLMRMQVDATTDPLFMVFWLRTSLMRRAVTAATRGTSPSIQKINQGAILQFPFPDDVPLKDQQLVARQLFEAEREAVAVEGLGREVLDGSKSLMSTILETDLDQLTAARAPVALGSESPTIAIGAVQSPR